MTANLKALVQKWLDESRRVGMLRDERMQGVSDALRQCAADLEHELPRAIETLPEEFVMVCKPPENLTSNGIAVDMQTGWVYVRHADGVNWTTSARLSELTFNMLRNYPPLKPPQVKP